MTRLVIRFTDLCDIKPKIVSFSGSVIPYPGDYGTDERGNTYQRNSDNTAWIRPSTSVFIYNNDTQTLTNKTISLSDNYISSNT